MTYEMLVGYSRFPFNASDEDELYDKIKNKEPRFPRTFTNLTEVDIYIIYTTVPAELSTFGGGQCDNDTVNEASFSHQMSAQHPVRCLCVV